MERYSDRDCVFSGPNSVVYKATAPSGDLVALKVVDIDLCRKPHDVRSEISILKQMLQKNVLSLIDVFDLHDDIVLVTPYYGFTLAELLKVNLKKSTKFNLDDPSKTTKIITNKLPLDDILRILQGLVKALNYLHNTAKVIHRDIKLENIFLSSLHSEPILGDFGISYSTLKPPKDEPPEVKYQDVSTGIYKPPELCFGVTNYSFEVDIWSLGVILTQLYSLTGQSFLECDGNDFVLINSIFLNFGTPSLDPLSPVYWPEMENDQYHFKNFTFASKPQKPTTELIPRADDIKIHDVFRAMTVYLKQSRINAAELCRLLAVH